MIKSLTPTERAAIERAAAEYVYWNTDSAVPRRPVNPKLLACVREAARALHKALQPFMDGPTEQPTAWRLALRMQEVEGLKRPIADYSDELLNLYWRTMVLDRACAAEVRPSRKTDPRVVEWICRAADAWVEAGGKASAKHRFGAAVLDFRAPGIPAVTSSAAVERALTDWKAGRAAKGAESGGALADSSG